MRQNFVVIFLFKYAAIKNREYQKILLRIATWNQKFIFFYLKNFTDTYTKIKGKKIVQNVK